MRVGILVEAGFLDHHVGVRNWLFSLYSYLSAGGRDVQFVANHRPRPGAAAWHRVHLRDPRTVANNGVAADWRVAGPAATVLAQFAAGPPPADAPAGPPVWYSHIGSRLEAAGCDSLVIGTPWLVDFPARLPVPVQVGVAYDVIPSRYCLTNADKPFDFAARHVAGFDYYRRHCDRTVAISPAVAADLVSLMGLPPAAVTVVPPMVPVGCLTPGDGTVARRRGAVLLASPLDRRKGLAAMPGLIGPAGGGVEVVLMYGGVRCPDADLRAFFAALPPELPVEWYPAATAATTERLFREAEALLFPSTSEGLGLPLIEAQLRGCPAVARPLSPMRELLVPGSRTLPGDPAGDRAVVADMLAARPFDHAGFETRARAFFDVGTLADRVRAAVGAG